MNVTISDSGKKPGRKAPRVEVITEGFVFPEGPIVDLQGTVYVCDQRGRCLYKVESPSFIKEVWLKMTGTPNGATWSLDRQRMFVTDSAEKQVLSVDLNKNVELVCASKGFNGPSDITVDWDGVIYFTDPSFEEDHSTVPQFVFALYPDGKLSQFGPYQQPNGIKFRNGVIYFAEGATGRVFRARPPKIDFRHWTTVFNVQGEPSKALDGVDVDKDGNVYVATYDLAKIEIFNSEGFPIGNITLPDTCPTNLEFDAEEECLFVTDANKGRLYRVTPTSLESGQRTYVTVEED